MLATETTFGGKLKI